MSNKTVTLELKRVSYIDVEVDMPSEGKPDNWLDLVKESGVVDDSEIEYITSATPSDSALRDEDQLQFDPSTEKLAELMRVMTEYRAEAVSMEGVSTSLLQQLAEQLDSCCTTQ